MAQQKKLGAVLFEDFELLDLYGPLEMFGNIGPELKIVTVAEQAGAVRSALLDHKQVLSSGTDERLTGPNTE